MTAIICGKCKRRHSSIQEVRNCYWPPAPVYTPAATRLATAKQIAFIGKLGGDKVYASTLSVEAASDYIKTLKKQENRPAMITKIPIPMLQTVPDGRYATRMDSDQPYKFFRISRPKSGNYKGCIKVQTQHSEAYQLMMVVRPSGSVEVYDLRAEEELLLVLVDPSGAGIAYGEELGHCMRCGRELTDERSRWYGIGPECEKSNQHIIDLVDDRKGSFRLGV